MTQIYIGSHGEISIRGDETVQSRLTILRQRVSGKAGRTLRGRQIFTALVDWQGSVRKAIQAQHGLTTLAEYQVYALETLPMAELIEAERLNEEGKTAPSLPTFQCRMAGCQARVAIRQALCTRCAHDED